MPYSKLGRDQSHMAAVVKDFHVPKSAFAGEDCPKTTQYEERNTSEQVKAAHKVEKHQYKGRYN